MNGNATFLKRSGELAEHLGQYRRVENSWFFPSESDTEEDEHRVDVLAGRIFCTCWGFRSWAHCRHSDLVRRIVEANVEERHLIVQDHADLPDVWRSPQDLARRLQDLKQERNLVQEFMRDVMVKSRDGEADGDYGIIPGTQKPTLFKAGAEKLCELYGYAPIVADMQETADSESGHYRCVIRLALVHKGSGVKIAEGVGQCTTRESKYWKRWVFERDIPAGLDKRSLKTRSGTAKSGRPWTQYQIENDDLHSLWNTVMKMAKKRALVDATLSATRSSGIFTQSAEHLDEWIDAEWQDVTRPDDEEVQGDDPPVETTPAPSPDEGPLLRRDGAVRERRGATQALKGEALTTPPVVSVEPVPPAEPEPRPSQSPAPATPPEASVEEEIAGYWKRFEAAPVEVKRTIITDCILDHIWIKWDDGSGNSFMDPVKAMAQGKGTQAEREALLAYLEKCPI